MIEAYPLQWPTGWRRLSDNLYRDPARFSTSFAAARDGLMLELERMRASNIVLSTNIPLRRDGLPYAAQREPDDPGAAVYFEYQGKSMVFACDRWEKVRDNVQALRKTVEAIRGIERWGASDMMERAFTGFQALPDKSGGNWWEVLGVNEHDHYEVVKKAYMKERSAAHRAEDTERFMTVNNAWDIYYAKVNAGV